GIIESSSAVESLARSISSTDGVYLVPAFSGLGAPHWDPHARGAILGITRGTTSAHIARAAIEGIAFQVDDVLQAMQGDSRIELAELRVDGGASANDLLLEFQSGLLGVPVLRPDVLETTALGAAYLAGLAVGFWSSQDELDSHWNLEKKFTPEMEASEVDRLKSGWNLALGRSKEWSNNL
ncbi:MAG: glycerol kinase, partial [Rhodothermales bacterium]|nr:glycerol kinase [Rhodothermales bacterium]